MPHVIERSEVTCLAAWKIRGSEHTLLPHSSPSIPPFKSTDHPFLQLQQQQAKQPQTSTAAMTANNPILSAGEFLDEYIESKDPTRTALFCL